jgi:hypothetical protein
MVHLEIAKLNDLVALFQFFITTYAKGVEDSQLKPLSNPNN